MAALTSTIVLKSGSCFVGQSVQAKVTVTNPNAYPVGILEIKPTLIFTGNSAAKDGSSFSVINMPPIQSAGQSVPGSSSQDFLFYISPNVPSINYDHTPGTYDVSCKISSNNGDNISPTPVTLQVNQVPNEASTP